VVGKFDPDALQAEVERTLGGWSNERPPPGPARLPEVGLPAAERTLVVPETGRTQSTITLACRIDDAAGEVAATLVATSIQSELWSTLRQAPGQTYGADVRIAQEDHGPVLQVSVQAPHAVAADTVATVREAVRGAAARIDERALARLKLATARRMALELQTTEQVLARLVRSAADGEPSEVLAGRAESLAAVDLAAIGAVLAPCAGREIVTVVGPESLAAELAALGLPAETLAR
jgi:predicted Zn-dependent peptidase